MYKPICTLYWSIQFALFLLGDHFFFDIYFSILILGLGFLQSYFSSNYIFSVEPRIVNISINSSLIFFVFIFTLTANNRKSNAFSKKYGGGGGQWHKVLSSWELRLMVQVRLPSGWNTLFAVQYWYWELCVENQWGGGRKCIFVNFSLWWCLNRWWMMVEVGQKVLFRPSWNHIFFQLGFYRKQ